MPQVAPPPAPPGNVYDKYSPDANPLARAITARFLREVDGLLAGVAPASLLDVGCGEGIATARWARLLPGCQLLGCDRTALAHEWDRRREAGPSNLSFTVADATELPFADGEFELVSAIEVLQLVAEPRCALAELVRVARRAILVSVPREPLWRTLNVARGAYLRRLGDTPGAVQHWSRRRFTEFVAAHARVDGVRAPLPWTIVLARV